MRIIDEHNYPPNIAVFKAGTINEAVIQADKLMHDPNVQGCVWLKEDGYAPCRQEILELIKKCNKDALSRRCSQSYEGFEDVEIKELKSSLSAMSNVFCKLKYEFNTYSLTGKPHMDGHVANSNVKSERLFRGLPVRITVSYDVMGTVVYEAKEFSDYHLALIKAGKFDEAIVADQADGWSVQLGHWLFIKPKAWGIDQALIHSSPDFSKLSVKKGRRFKVVDVMPCPL